MIVHTVSRVYTEWLKKYPVRRGSHPKLNSLDRSKIGKDHTPFFFFNFQLEKYKYHTKVIFVTVLIFHVIIILHC